MIRKQEYELSLLKAMLALYIIMAFVLAGLNFGYARQAPEEVATLINSVWHFYENWLKTIFIAAGGLLTLRLSHRAGRTSMRRNNLVGFFITALLIHIIGPYLFNNPNLYYFAMPIPWTNQPLQLMVSGTDFRESFLALHGKAGVSATLLLYLVITTVVFAGTIIRGRRWQCSTLCLFSGFISEVFAPAFPLVGKRKKAGPFALKLFRVLRWVFLAIALFFTVYWLLIIAGLISTSDFAFFSQLEIYKYLFFDLIAAMLIWTFFTGRGYCYYCPLGTVTGLLAHTSGQGIVTNLKECISCGKCNKACPMAIDIMSGAREGKVVRNLNCVGCGHCVDTCPTGTLAYATRFSQPKV
jgi:ferredoxin-type protein NapH